MRTYFVIGERGRAGGQIFPGSQHQQAGRAPYGPYPPYGGYAPPPAPKPGIIPLRPLGVGEILDGAFSVIRWNPKAVLLPSAVVATVASVVYAVVAFFLERDLRASFTLSPGGDTLSPSQAGSLGVTEFAVGATDLLIGALSGVILTTVLAAVIWPAVVGRRETPGRSWRAARSRLGPAIAARLLAVVFAGGGWLLAVGLSAGIGFALGAGAHLAPLGVIVGVAGALAATVFAVVMWYRWSLAVPAVTLEPAGPLKGMGRSWRLVRGSWWRVWGILVLTELIVGLASVLLRLPFFIGSGGLGLLSGPSAAAASVPALALAAVGNIVSGTLLSPLSAAVAVLLYADLRMRREGMDIVMRASAAAPPSAAAADQGPGTRGTGSW